MVQSYIHLNYNMQGLRLRLTKLLVLLKLRSSSPAGRHGSSSHDTESSSLRSRSVPKSERSQDSDGSRQSGQRTRTRSLGSLENKTSQRIGYSTSRSVKNTSIEEKKEMGKMGEMGEMVEKIDMGEMNQSITSPFLVSCNTGTQV